MVKRTLYSVQTLREFLIQKILWTQEEIRDRENWRRKREEEKETLNLEQYPLNLEQEDANEIRSEAPKALV